MFKLFRFKYLFQPPAEDAAAPSAVGFESFFKVSSCNVKLKKYILIDESGCIFLSFP